MTENAMPDFYAQGYAQSADGHEAMDSFVENDILPVMDQTMVDATMNNEEGAQTLDQIICRNDLELDRQQSSFDPNYPTTTHDPAASNRSQADPGPVKFGSSHQSDSMQFSFPANQPSNVISTPIPNVATLPKQTPSRSLPSQESLPSNGHFGPMHATLGSVPDYAHPIMTNTSNGHPSLPSNDSGNNPPMRLDTSHSYLPPNMDVSVAFDRPTAPQESSLSGQTPMEQAPFYQTPASAGTHHPFSPVFPNIGPESPASHPSIIDQSLMERISQMRMPDAMQALSGRASRRDMPQINIQPTGANSINANLSDVRPQSGPQPPPQSRPPPTKMPSQVNAGMMDVSGNGKIQTDLRPLVEDGGKRG